MVGTWLIHVNIPNDGHLLTQFWQEKYEILEMSTHPKIKAYTEWVNVILGESKYK